MSHEIVRHPQKTAPDFLQEPGVGVKLSCDTKNYASKVYALDNRHAKEHLPQISTAAQMGGGTVLYVHQMRVFSVVTQGHYRGNCPADGPSTPNANRFQRCPREGKSQNNT